MRRLMIAAVTAFCLGSSGSTAMADETMTGEMGQVSSEMNAEQKPKKTEMKEKKTHKEKKKAKHGKSKAKGHKGSAKGKSGASKAAGNIEPVVPAEASSPALAPPAAP